MGCGYGRRAACRSTLVDAFAFSPDGRLIVMGSYKTVRVWDAATGAERRVLPIDTVLRFLSFSSCGKHLVTDHGALRLPYSDCRCSHHIFAIRSWVTDNDRLKEFSSPPRLLEVADRNVAEELLPKRSRRGGSIALPPVVLVRICVVANASDRETMTETKRAYMATNSIVHTNRTFRPGLLKYVLAAWPSPAWSRYQSCTVEALLPLLSPLGTSQKPCHSLVAIL